MRKIIFGLALLLLLGACAAKPAAEVDIAREVRAFYLDSGVAMTMTIGADFGDRVSEFTVDYQGFADGSAVVTVLSPKEIAGITARVTATNTSLVYDDLILELGRLSGTALTPMDAAPSVVRALREGHAANTAKTKVGEKACWQITYASEENGKPVERQVWLDEKTLAVVRAEVFADGGRVLTLTNNFVQP
ncbi:hypothetical protein FACS1894202_13550 [Clostridia bacterium]|nr:hypothetical protein FACS1894202_13550 [Clostridia bacterium]